MDRGKSPTHVTRPTVDTRGYLSGYGLRGYPIMRRVIVPIYRPWISVKHTPASTTFSVSRNEFCGSHLLMAYSNTISEEGKR